MTNNHMRLLTEQALQSIYGGNIFTSIWNWIKKHLLCPTFNLYTRFKNTDTGIEKVSFGAIHADAIQRMGKQDEPHLAASELPTKKTATWARQLQFDMKFIQSFRLLLLQRDFRTAAVASVIPIKRSPNVVTLLQKFDCIFVETQHIPPYSGTFQHNLV